MVAYGIVFIITITVGYSEDHRQVDQIVRNFTMWATLEVSGDFLGENVACFRYLTSSEGV